MLGISLCRAIWSLGFHGSSEICLVLADFLVPAHDWCRLSALRALLIIPKYSFLSSECPDIRMLSGSHHLVKHSILFSYLCSKCSLQLDCQFPPMPYNLLPRSKCTLGIFKMCLWVSSHLLLLFFFKAESHIAQTSLTLTI